MVEKSKYDYDLFVIGGGSGGLATSKSAAELGKKVGLADFVKPTPIGTKWGLGGTCVNVGCIPKKLMHYAGLSYEKLDEFEHLGYPEKIEKKHNWELMIKKINLYIKKLNFGFRTSLRNKKVEYHNCLASFVDNHTLLLKDKDGKEKTVTSEKILVAVGGRPNYPDVEGAKENCITSDDVFSLKKSPGKTLVVGASYIALECGGFLTGLGYDTDVMVRSILLRGFDQDFAKRIGTYMEQSGTNFINQATPSKFVKKDNGKIEVYYQKGDSKDVITGEYDTVLLAIGRKADTHLLNIEKAGVKLNEKNGKILVNDEEQTNVSNIYSLGDCAENRPELTPPAIRAGRLLSNRLFNNKTQLMNYRNIATTVFTPLEYGCVGYNEEDAIKTFGEENLKIYHSEFTPLEWNFNTNRNQNGYMKLICENKGDEKVLGFHILSPNAGEITQGIAVAINIGVTKKHLNDTVGIHPTIAEEFTTLTALKSEDAQNEGC